MDHSPLVVKKDLNTEERVAVLLASLDQKLAAAILQHLEPTVMIRVANAIRSLGIVPGPLRDKAIADCLRGIHELGGAVQGDDKTVHALLNQAIGEKRAAVMMMETQGSGRSNFAELAEMSAEQVTTILTREQPGVIALVLRHVPSALAAEILALLPSELRRRVIVFLCTADSPSDEIVSRVESLVNAKTGGSRKAKKASESDKLDVVTTIIQHAKRSVEEDLLAAIQEKSETLATEIRDRLFTFEDIVKLSDMAIRRVMQEIDMSVLGIALRNAPLELREKFTCNMSKRAAEGLKEEMEFSQKVRLTDVEAKQREIVNVIRTLVSENQISLGGEDEYV